MGLPLSFRLPQLMIRPTQTPYATIKPFALTALVMLFGPRVSAVTAQTQMPDARVLPKGVLRITFEPHYTNYDQRFSKNTRGLEDGTEEPLGTDLTADTVGSNFFATLRPAEGALQNLLGDPDYRVNLGSFATDLDADIRRFPFELSLGVTDRLTIRAEIPIVTARINAFVAFDSTDANVGWNQVASVAGNVNALAQVISLLSGLDAAMSQINDLTEQGAFGCPTSTQCQSVLALLDRARALRSQLGTITGVVPGTGRSANLPPAAPLVGSQAGTALTTEIQDVTAQLVGFGASPIAGSLPLPQNPLGRDEIDFILSDAEFGYGLFPLTTTKMSRLGDAEIGVRYQLVNTLRTRTVLHTTVRLPTGTVDRTNHPIDLGTGDRQTDVQGGFEFVYSSADRIGVSAAADYTIQLSHELVRRATPPQRPISPIIDELVVRRDLGDIFRASIYPWLALSEGVTVYASANYYTKKADSYSSIQQPLFTNSVDDLGLESSRRVVSFGGGIRYRSTRSGSAGAGRLPIEAGLSYRSAFSGSGGLTPKFNTLNIHLKLYYRLFGGSN